MITYFSFHKICNNILVWCGVVLLCSCSVELGRQLVFMAIALKSSCFLQLNKPDSGFRVSFYSKKPIIISVKRYTPVAATAIRTMETVGLSETFDRLKKQGKVSVLIYYYYFFCLCSNFHACHIFCLQLE